MGEVDFYTFEGAAGDAVFIVLANGDGVNNMTAEVFGPRGNRESFADTFSYSVSATIDITLDTSGQYTVRVRNRGIETGGYTLSLFQPLQGGGTTFISNSSRQAEIELLGEVHWYTFQGLAGDAVFIVLANGDGVNDMTVDVFGPGGNQESVTNTFSYSVSATIDITLDTSGQYTVRVRNRGTETGAYTLSFFQPLQEGGTPLVSDSSLQAEIGLLGEVHWYTFQGQAGDAVCIVLANGDGVNNMTAELFGPLGNRKSFTDTFSYSVSATIDVTLGNSGQYTDT